MERREARIQRNGDAAGEAHSRGHDARRSTSCRPAARAERKGRRDPQARVSESHASVRPAQSDGGMLIGLAGPGEVRRVDASGATVTTFAGANSATRMAWTSGFALTPEGGGIVSDYMGSR